MRGRDPIPGVVALGAGRGRVVRGADGKRRFRPPPPLEPLVPDALAAKAALVGDVQALLRQGPPPGDGGARAAAAQEAARGLGWGPRGDDATPRGDSAASHVEFAGTSAVMLPAVHARNPAASAAASAASAAAAGRSQFPWRQGRQQTAALAAAAAQAQAVARASGPGAHPLVRLGSSDLGAPPRALLPSQLLQPAYASASLAGAQFAPALAHQHAAVGSSSSSGSLRLPARAGFPLASYLSTAPGLSAASSAYSSRPR